MQIYIVYKERRKVMDTRNIQIVQKLHNILNMIKGFDSAYENKAMKRIRHSIRYVKRISIFGNRKTKNYRKRGRNLW